MGIISKQNKLKVKLIYIKKYLKANVIDAKEYASEGSV